MRLKCSSCKKDLSTIVDYKLNMKKLLVGSWNCDAWMPRSREACVSHKGL